MLIFIIICIKFLMNYLSKTIKTFQLLFHIILTSHPSNLLKKLFYLINYKGYYKNNYFNCNSNKTNNLE